MHRGGAVNATINYNGKNDEVAVLGEASLGTMILGEDG